MRKNGKKVLALLMGLVTAASLAACAGAPAEAPAPSVAQEDYDALLEENRQLREELDLLKAGLAEADEEEDLPAPEEEETPEEEPLEEAAPALPPEEAAPPAEETQAQQAAPPAEPAAASPWEERVNALTLSPVDPDPITDPFAQEIYGRYTSLVEPGMTNWELLRAVYDYVVQNYRTNTLKRTNLPGSFQCTSYAHELCQGLYVVGFDVRYMSGKCTAKGGGWTGHAWSAIVVGDDLLYLDANIPAEHGGNPDTYFAVTPGSNGIYRSDLVKMVEYSPDLMTTTVYSP